MMVSMDFACAPILASELRGVQSTCSAAARHPSSAMAEEVIQVGMLVDEEADVRGVPGENFLRVARDVWK